MLTKIYLLSSLAMPALYFKPEAKTKSLFSSLDKIFIIKNPELERARECLEFGPFQINPIVVNEDSRMG